jgi:hypothetical protein
MALMYGTLLNTGIDGIDEKTKKTYGLVRKHQYIVLGDETTLIEEQAITRVIAFDSWYEITTRGASITLDRTKHEIRTLIRVC